MLYTILVAELIRLVIEEIPYIEPISIGEKYEFSYRGIDYAGKTVLDIGADVGSTASYFLRRGARGVIAVEASKKYFDILLENAKGMRGLCTPIFMKVTEPVQLSSLLDTYKPDVLHMDCEGCERVLLSIKVEEWKNVPEYELEVHYNKDMLFYFIEKFLNIRYEVFLFVIDPINHAWALTAKKIPEKDYEAIPNKGYRM